MLELLFWTSIALVAYAFVGYGIVLGLMVWLKRMYKGKPTPPTPEEWPEVTFTVCAFNEEDWIREKIENGLSFDYPKDKIAFFFVTDGSDDQTPNIVRHYPFPEGVKWKLLHSEARKGKIAAFHRSMAFVETPIVISTDANTLVNKEAIKNIVRHFEDSKVGAVAGEKRIFVDEADSASSAGEGIYWKYESLLKRWDSELYSTCGAAGELFSIRTDLYQAVPHDTIIEDFFLTMRIAQDGYRIQYEPEAHASETASANVAEELKRKIRIAAGGLQAIVRLAPLLNPFKHGVFTFQYVSHRVLRWTITPFLLVFIFFANAFLAGHEGLFYKVLFGLQCIFYASAFLGWMLEQRKIKVKALFVPYYFCVMNYSVLMGWGRFLKGSQSVIWERAERAKA